MESRAVASPGTGGLAGAPLTPSKKGWVGCRLGEAGEGQAGDKACWGRQATAKPVIPQGNTYWSILQTGHSQSAMSPEHHTTAKVNHQLEPHDSKLPSTVRVVKATIVSGSSGFLQGVV